jgi:hypothetical protein
MVVSVVMVMKVGLLLGQLADSGTVLLQEVFCCYGDILKIDKSPGTHQINIIISLIFFSPVFSHCSMKTPLDCSCSAPVGRSRH